MNKDKIIKIPLKEFIDCYAQSLGQEGAEKIVKDAIRRVGYPLQYEYTKEEAIRILEELQKQPGFVGIIAGILLSRTYIRNQ